MSGDIDEDSDYETIYDSRNSDIVQMRDDLNHVLDLLNVCISALSNREQNGDNLSQSTAMVLSETVCPKIKQIEKGLQDV